MKRDDLAAARMAIPTQPAPQDTDDFIDGDDLDDDGESTARDVALEEEPAELDARGKQILAFEKHWWRQAGAKEQAIRDTFGLSATRYYQLLNALPDDPLALAHDPLIVRRLRRLRASRARRR